MASFGKRRPSAGLVLAVVVVVVAALGAAAAAAPQAPAKPAVTGGSDWSATATQFRGHNGLRVTYICPAGGVAHRLWGTNVYTDDSSVCTAAVHAGRITLASGGTVSIQISPARRSYRGTTRYGIVSGSWHSWHGSFIVVGSSKLPPPTSTTTTTAPTQPPATGGSDWAATATAYRGENGSRYTYACPEGGTAHTVWGTDVYTDDSSVCTAAVHAGRITLAAGGRVTIEIRPALTAYTGSTRNGITTSPWGSWHGSFVVVG